MGLISYGTTIFDAGAMASGFSSNMIKIRKQTASSDANVTFLNGGSGVVFASTYSEYFFTLKNIHPSSDPGIISFQATTDGTNYNTTATTTYYRANHGEDDGSTGLAYATGFDHAQGTAVINLDSGSGNDNDQASSGFLRVFAPSSTTFVKHFIAQVSDSNDGDVHHTYLLQVILIQQVPLQE